MRRSGIVAPKRDMSTGPGVQLGPIRPSWMHSARETDSMSIQELKP